MHLNKKIIVLLLCFTFIDVKLLFAQNQKGWFNHYEIGVEKSFFTSVDIYSLYWETSDEIGFKLSVGNGFVFNKKLLIAPNFGVTYNISQFFFLRTDLALYNNFKDAQPIITPKLGIGILGASFFYGRNINLNQHTRFKSLGSNQFGVSFNFIPKFSLPIGF